MTLARQLHDCKAVIRWLRTNAEKYGYDPDRIGIIGAAGKSRRTMIGGEFGHQCFGTMISTPYFDAIFSNFSISSFVGGKAVVEASGSSTRKSKNIFSRPAGATEISIFTSFRQPAVVPILDQYQS